MNEPKLEIKPAEIFPGWQYTFMTLVVLIEFNLFQRLWIPISYVPLLIWTIIVVAITFNHIRGKIEESNIKQNLFINGNDEKLIRQINLKKYSKLKYQNLIRIVRSISFLLIYISFFLMGISFLGISLILQHSSQIVLSLISFVVSLFFFEIGLGFIFSIPSIIIQKKHLTQYYLILIQREERYSVVNREVIYFLKSISREVSVGEKRDIRYSASFLEILNNIPQLSEKFKKEYITEVLNSIKQEKYSNLIFISQKYSNKLKNNREYSVLKNKLKIDYGLKKFNLFEYQKKRYDSEKIWSIFSEFINKDYKPILVVLMLMVFVGLVVVNSLFFFFPKTKEMLSPLIEFIKQFLNIIKLK